MLHLLRRSALFFGLIILLHGCAGSKGVTEIRPDLVLLAQSNRLQPINRSVTTFDEGTRRVLHVDSRPQDGIVWVPGVAFSNGTIEFDVRGKEVPQRSFVGVAFHGIDNQTYETVYFRPFNFRSTDATANTHAVQYEAEPEYSWERLRKERMNQYEAALEPAPDPKEWFHVRIEVQSPRVRVYVNDAKEPCLAVTELNSRTGTQLGLFVGDNSDGDFANLRIRTKR